MNYQIELYNEKEKFPFISHIQEYAHKIGVVKTDDEALGVLIKGVGKSFDTVAFRENMVAGEFIQFRDSGYASQIILSKTIATKLKKNVGDEIIVHFFQNPPRFRRLKVRGIYETNLSEYFDSRVIIGDIRMIQRLNDWSDSLASGLEVFVHDPEQVDNAGVAIGEMMDYDLNIERVSDKFIQVFEWLELLSRQVNILLGILINCVVIFIVLGSLKWIERALGPNGLLVVRKFFGVILLAIAVKIFGTNIVKFGK